MKRLCSACQHFYFLPIEILTFYGEVFILAIKQHVIVIKELNYSAVNYRSYTFCKLRHLRPLEHMLQYLCQYLLPVVSSSCSHLLNLSSFSCIHCKVGMQIFHIVLKMVWDWQYFISHICSMSIVLVSYTKRVLSPDLLLNYLGLV